MTKEQPIDNDSAFWQLELTVAKTDAQKVEEFFLSSGAIGFYELLYEENVTHNLTTDTTQLFFFFELSYPVAAVTIMGLEVLQLPQTPQQIKKILFAEYVKMFEQYFQAFQLGERLWLVPPWDLATFTKSHPQTPFFLLKPGLAFGTGKHITSQLMTKYIEREIQANDIVFDLGCGSGILSLAAATCGAQKVTGADVIKLAVESSQENLKTNCEYFDLQQADHLYRQVNFLKGDFTFIDSADFDTNTNVFLANILAKVFYANKELLKKYLEHCPKWALSGITELQQQEFSQFLEELGIHQFTVIAEEEWCIFYNK